MTQKERVSEVVIVAGLIAFALYKYSKMSEPEKDRIHDDLKHIGERLAKEVLPDKIKSFLPAHWKE